MRADASKDSDGKDIATNGKYHRVSMNSSYRSLSGAGRVSSFSDGPEGFHAMQQCKAKYICMVCFIDHICSNEALDLH
jgi:hypothetical protein